MAIIAILALLIGLVLGFVVVKLWMHGQAAEPEQIEKPSEKPVEPEPKPAEQPDYKALEEAQEKARKAKADADAKMRRARQLEQEVKSARREIQKKEDRLLRKEELVDKKADILDNRERELNRLEARLNKLQDQIKNKQQETEELGKSIKDRLEEIAGMTQDEARAELKKAMMDEVRLEVAREVRSIEEEAKEEAEKRAKKIIATAIGRYASEYVNERTVSVVSLPNEEMKGRIIGREGRNIRAFEAATGVDLIIDDTPEAAVVSNFNPIRREVARRSLEKLVQDGRIHPARIEEVVQRATKEVEQLTRQAGQEALFQLGISNMHPELVKLLGQLKFRQSYTQNVLQHSIEVAYIAGMMAAELGMDQKKAQRAGLLHDIGKAVDHEVDGPHALIGANLARKYKEKAEVVHAIAAHHFDERPLTVLAHLVIAADAMSGARPGARRETLSNYINRLEDLEKIANSRAGVAKSYAIQAGREIRVMVENAKISDDAAAVLAREIAKEIEEKLTFPGQIKVCVIRESRFVEYAK